MSAVLIGALKVDNIGKVRVYAFDGSWKKRGDDLGGYMWIILVEMYLFQMMPADLLFHIGMPRYDRWEKVDAARFETNEWNGFARGLLGSAFLIMMILRAIMFVRLWKYQGAENVLMLVLEIKGGWRRIVFKDYLVKVYGEHIQYLFFVFL